jgi:hypothetical protein
MDRFGLLLFLSTTSFSGHRCPSLVSICNPVFFDKRFPILSLIKLPGIDDRLFFNQKDALDCKGYRFSQGVSLLRYCCLPSSLPVLLFF